MLRSVVQSSVRLACVSRKPALSSAVAVRAYRPSMPKTSVDDNFEENVRLVQQKLEMEKEKVLHGQVFSSVENAPGWNEQLASQSEIVIKAEREPSKPFDELRRETVTYLERIRDEAEGGRRRLQTSVDENWEENLRLARVMVDLERDRTLQGNVVSSIGHAEGWNEALADESEIVIKAEREPAKGFDEMRAESVTVIARKHNLRSPPKTSVDDNFEENNRLQRIKLELEKNRSLNGNVKSSIAHAEGWSEELADESEIVIKAEREPSTSLEELREHSTRFLQQKRREYSGVGPMYRTKLPTSVDDNAEENDRVARTKIELEKARSLSGAVKSSIRGAPKWSEALASESESVVKADREPKRSFKALRRHSVKTMKANEEK